MNDNKVIKALKLCTSEHMGCEDDCPYATKKLTYSQCKLELSKDIIDLINRQKEDIKKLEKIEKYSVGVIKKQDADIERLKTAYETLKQEYDDMFSANRNLMAEVERLKDFIEKDQGLILKLTGVPVDEYNQKIKSEAIKEFQHKSESILIKLYEEYHRIANKPNNAWFKRFTKEENEMFYQGRAEAIWECISVNRDIVKEMVGDNNV